jgi:peroxiredoxin
VTTTAGDALPGLALTGTDGRTVRLDALRGEAHLLVFLRHLA